MDLHAGEQVIFKGHPSWRSTMQFYLGGVLLAAAAGVVAALIEDTGLGVIVGICLLVVVLIVGWIKRLATDYMVTTERLHIRKGIIARNVQETRLERVQNVNYRQSAIQRLLQVGDVDFDTAAGDDYNFVFNGVAEPADVVHRVDVATGQSGSAGLGDDRAEAPAAARRAGRWPRARRGRLPRRPSRAARPR